MEVGLEVYNDNSVLQINNSYRNHHMMQKGSYTVTHANGDYSGTLPQGVVYSGRNPFIAIKSSRYIRIVREKSGSTFHFRFIWNEEGSAVPSSWTLDYYVYDALPPTPSAHGIGLQTFDASGYPIFDSGFPPCNVIDMIQQVAIFHPVTSTTRSYNYPIQNLAVAMCQQAYYLLEVSFEAPNGQFIPGTEYYSIRAKTSSGLITTLDTMERNNAGAPGTNARQNNAAYLVIDVTNV